MEFRVSSKGLNSLNRDFLESDSMRFLKWFSGKAELKPESVEEVPVVEIEETPSRMGEPEPIYIKSMELRGLMDVQGVADELRDGNIVVLDIGSLLNQDPEELKRAIDQLKGVCHTIGGDVGRLTESKVIATPKYVNIQFKRVEG